MNEPSISREQSWLITISLVILASTAVAGALAYTSSVMVPLVLAIFISYMVTPMVNYLQVHARIPRPISLFITMLFVMAILTVFGLLITYSTGQMLENSDRYRGQLENTANKIIEKVPKILERMSSLVMPGDSPSEVTSTDAGENDGSGLNRETPTEAESSIAEAEPAESQGGSAEPKKETGERSFPVSEIIQKFSGTIPTSVGAMLTGTANAVVNIVSNGFLVLVFILFLILGATPDRKPKGIFAEIDEKVRRYIVIKIVSSAVTGTLVAIILTFLKLDLALAFGVLAFLLNFIPSIGSVISTMLPIPVAMVQYDSMWMVLWVLLLPGTVQIVVGNIIEPKVMGDGLDLHPITILVALIFWGLLWGIPGMFMAAPITAVIKIVSSRFETTRPAAELMAGRFPDFDEAPEQNTG